MNASQSGRSLVARVATVVFSLAMLAGFLWYSHVKAQPKPEAGSGADRALQPDDIDRLLKQSSNTADRQSGPGSPALISGSKSYAGAIIQVDGKMSVHGASPAPPQQAAKPVLLPGSKAMPSPLFRTAVPTAPLTPPAPPAPPPGQKKMEAPAPSPTLMLGSKSGAVFVPAPPVKPPQEAAKPPAKTPEPPQAPAEVQPAPGQKSEAPQVPQASQTHGTAPNHNRRLMTSSKWVRVFEPGPNQDQRKSATDASDPPQMLKPASPAGEVPPAPKRDTWLKGWLGRLMP